MKKWLFLFGGLILIYFLGRWGRARRSSHPLLARINQTISLVVWVLLLAYAFSFVYWLITEVF